MLLADSTQETSYKTTLAGLKVDMKIDRSSKSIIEQYQSYMT